MVVEFMLRGSKTEIDTDAIISLLKAGNDIENEYIIGTIQELVAKCEALEPLNHSIPNIPRIVDEQAKEIKRLEAELKQLKEENEDEYLKGRCLKERIERLVNANKKKVEYVSTLKKKHDIEVKDLRDKIHTANTAKMLNKFYRHELKRRGVKFIKMDDGYGRFVNVMYGAEIDSNYLIKVANMTEEELDSADNE